MVVCRFVRVVQVVDSRIFITETMETKRVVWLCCLSMNVIRVTDKICSCLFIPNCTRKHVTIYTNHRFNGQVACIRCSDACVEFVRSLILYCIETEFTLLLITKEMSMLFLSQSSVEVAIYNKL